ncbi:MAG: hypothetical protein ACTS4V_01715 [Candidatus Hodgkinia cicadicola]
MHLAFKRPSAEYSKGWTFNLGYLTSAETPLRNQISICNSFLIIGSHFGGASRTKSPIKPWFGVISSGYELLRRMRR